MDDQDIKRLVDEIIILHGMSFGLIYKLLDKEFNKYYFETKFDVDKIIAEICSIFGFEDIKNKIKTYFKQNGIVFDGYGPNSQPEKSLAEYISEFDYNDTLRKELVELFKKNCCFKRINLDQLSKLRQTPLYIKIMGEYALYSLPLPGIIGQAFSSPLEYEKGFFFYYPNMTQKRFEKDILEYGTFFMNQLSSGIINANKYNGYMTMLEYLDNYFMLCKEGVQIPIRPISKTNYEEMDMIIKRYERKGIFCGYTAIEKIDEIKRIKDNELIVYLEQLMHRPIEDDGHYVKVLAMRPNSCKGKYNRSSQSRVTN